ncbi:mitochondrial ribosomal death-associated protein 3-domain-containing protein [Staphylotrichum tortipilum]|uniref:Small ribosomal subunit protein mS29 n=1 Tax=Staphylotrichum tortipilum TaxID=2831512 RepID=A0AAN6MPU0_9PEZI|nr:mitochondrial ribosomal death-associated protein 3-domain-containing protein [Staphylotrichum longicolle]
MPAPNCLRCLARPPPGLATPVPRTAAAASPLLNRPAATPIGTRTRAHAAPFSTTPAPAGPPVKPATPVGSGGHNRVGKKLKLGKFKTDRAAERSKVPLPGERKAYRKRITLSNDNALPVPWLADLTPSSLADPANTATVMGLPDSLQDQLRASDAFKPSQSWGMFRKPAVLVRKETVDLVNRMQDAADKKQTLRLVVTGDKVTGKSMLLLQAMAHAYLNNWIVIHLPEGQDLTTACTEYSPLADTDPVQYSQPVYVFKLIQAIKKANENLLSKMYTAVGHPGLPQSITANTSLLTLANVAKEPDAAWPVFRALWHELTHRSVARPPILFTLDGLSHITRVSDYRSPAFELIHSYDLALLRLFTDGLGGSLRLPWGGAVLAATSRSNAPRSPSMELALAQREAEQLQREVPKKDPFFRGYDERAEASLRSVQVLPVGGIDKVEARGLMEYWAASGMLRATVDNKSVSEKWTLAGNGVLGEMERASLLTMRV